jgi:hypothetical protein
MAQRRDDWRSVTAIGREVECIQQRQFAPTQEPAGGIVTAQADLYLAVIVTVMFLAGGVLVILYGRERSQARTRGNSAPGV